MELAFPLFTQDIFLSNEDIVPHNNLILNMNIPNHFR